MTTDDDTIPVGSLITYARMTGGKAYGIIGEILKDDGDGELFYQIVGENGKSIALWTYELRLSFDVRIIDAMAEL